MRQITLSEVLPNMVLARSILNSKGQILLVSGISLTEEYLYKLKNLNIDSIFITDAQYEDIIVPEYVSLKTQQRALSILTTTMDKIHKEGTFVFDDISAIATDIVEELIIQADVVIHLTGIATHDDYTLAHSLNCAIYIALLARFCGFTVSQIKIITCGALLHDMGKTLIDKDLLNKPGRLDADEFAIIQQHSALGFNILTKKRLEISSLVAHMAWQHHEKIDGTGYPRGLQGEEILSYARLLAIIDVYEAITGNRPYRKAMKPADAYNIIHDGLGTAFDETYGRIFLSRISFYSPGTKVILNTGEEAIVISVPVDFPQRPLVRLISLPNGMPYTVPKDIHLIDHPHLSISSN